MAFLHFLDPANRSVEGDERGLLGIGQFHFREGDMVEPELLRVQHGAETIDVTVVDQTLQAQRAGRLRKTDDLGHFRDGNPRVFNEKIEDLAIYRVYFTAT